VSLDFVEDAGGGRSHHENVTRVQPTARILAEVQRFLSSRFCRIIVSQYLAFL